jgi:hypothetical protein
MWGPGTIIARRINQNKLAVAKITAEKDQEHEILLKRTDLRNMMVYSFLSE